jgi:hypothetical protein
VSTPRYTRRRWPRDNGHRMQGIALNAGIHNRVLARILKQQQHLEEDKISLLVFKNHGEPFHCAIWV